MQYLTIIHNLLKELQVNYHRTEKEKKPSDIVLVSELSVYVHVYALLLLCPPYVYLCKCCHTGL